MEVARFEEMQVEFMWRLSQAVYCTLATADREYRPRDGFAEWIDATDEERWLWDSHQTTPPP